MLHVYPHAATNDGRRRVRVQEALTAFARTSQPLSPDQFEKAWLEFRATVSPDLGATGIAPEVT